MPSQDEVDKAILAIKYASDNKIYTVKLSDAVIILYAYREELLKSMGIKEYKHGI